MKYTKKNINGIIFEVDNNTYRLEYPGKLRGYDVDIYYHNKKNNDYCTGYNLDNVFNNLNINKVWIVQNVKPEIVNNYDIY